MADRTGADRDPTAGFSAFDITAEVLGAMSRCAERPMPPVPPAPPDFLFDAAGGPIEGGTDLIMSGGSDAYARPYVYTDTTFDDDFTGAVIDVALWWTGVTGSGTVTQDDRLLLRSGTTPNSSARLTSVGTFGATGAFEAAFTIETDVIDQPPADTTRLFDFELQVDASNYFRVSREFDASLPAGSRHIFRFLCVVGGTTVEDVITPSTMLSGTIRITRVRNRVIVEANGTRIYDAAPFTVTAASVVFRVANPSATHPYDFTTSVDDFSCPTVVLFGDEPALIREVSASLVRVESPAVATPRTVSITVWTAAGLALTVPDAFTYELSFEFLILQEAGTTIGLVGDRTLRNLRTGRYGLLA